MLYAHAHTRPAVHFNSSAPPRSVATSMSVSDVPVTTLSYSLLLLLVLEVLKFRLPVPVLRDEEIRQCGTIESQKEVNPLVDSTDYWRT